ncbi:hypothetical protein [Caminibacter mediatlanticus]|uniref:Uncharacterized protein n=1 Tax=Caminibacter mediatlanticus TB-2 TaxID=391592 RepID=A0AAI9AH64_9BACT|nr:hypothetical protein [Caminibacter mediatlanticus]EDM23563.1 hypothetical protein CMTB2_04742 [Caminibacter mediatlanticus TB-2]
MEITIKDNIENFDLDLLKEFLKKIKSGIIEIKIKEDETEYLLKNEANKKWLLQSISSYKDNKIIKKEL